MEPESETVVVVVDPLCGDRLADLVKCAPVWVVDSAMNRPVVERLWSQSGESISLTAFDPVEDEPPSATLMRMLDTISLHHPHCEGYRIYGASLTNDVCEELARMGYPYNASTHYGFAANKTGLT